MSLPTFGLWPSPLSPRDMATRLRLDDLLWDSDGRRLVWLEARDGRGALWCVDVRSGEAPRELTPATMSVRARVGYGGGAFCVARGQVYFAEASTGRLMRQSLAGGLPQAITPAFGAAAAPALSPDGRWLAYVHSYEHEDVLAIVDAAGRQWPQRLVAGRDFFSWPCWHPSAPQLAYVAWDHPAMPWDSSKLYLHELDLTGATPKLRTSIEIAGGTNTAVFQPCFSPDGRYLAYVADPSGWGQVYLRDLKSGEQRQLTNEAAEHGHPAWVQGMRTLAWSATGEQLFYLRNRGGVRQIWAQALAGGPAQLRSNEGEGSWFEQLAAAPSAALATIAAASGMPPQVIVLDETETRVLRRSLDELAPPSELAAAKAVQWQTPSGPVFGLLYLPPGYMPAPGSPLAPAVVRAHSGPTSQATAGWEGEAQFLATRGYVVLDVNYRGSTGYGRAYMEAGRGQWGLVDVADTISAARYLADEGLADRARIVVMGSSAGGLTALEALCEAPELFRAGICAYAVTNLLALAADTHKFEAHYNDTLIGPLPEAAERYRERSPALHPERIRVPVAIFQGADDRVVPPEQAEQIVAALRQQGTPHLYRLFPGEGHGWRRAETIESYYRELEEFLQQFVLRP